ncbi:protein-disulfide reductase DsbD domain-containing protein [Maritalea mediterranea]|uniref:Thiol:disulfide interchange protein DsbD N-terminal domain-containing protein n=1 Tax=Maritalea mediterranea TaxID=2909667 RepID=A0ABS9E6G7_9HYPH|nr:protein-disulfide reductase DsbD domain-containing protein [Maritalea mediterranea]MCF4097807.1 hypothetical protein [Maritalea mediterranea]
MTSRLFLLFAILIATLGAARADTGAWVNVAPGAKIRLLTADQVGPDSSMLAGLEFQLRDGMKTYWRVPGESGIPLTADWEKSQGIKRVDFLWPMPKRELDKGYFDYVYKEDFILPFAVHLDESDAAVPPRLVGELMLGICGEICVPVKFKIDRALTLDREDRPVGFKLSAALSYVPVEDDRADAPFDAVYFDSENDQLLVPMSSDPKENETLILDLPIQSLLFDVPQNRPGSSVLTIQPLNEISLADHIGSAVRLTYSGRAGAFEKTAPVLSIEALDQ